MRRRLVDTSVWIAFFAGRSEAGQMVQWVLEEGVVLHPFVEGELFLGGLSSRNASLLASLPRCEVVEHAGVMALAANARLRNTGIGWVDMHLLASAREGNLDLVTMDRALAMQWKRICTRR